MCCCCSGVCRSSIADRGPAVAEDRERLLETGASGGPRTSGLVSMAPACHC